MGRVITITMRCNNTKRDYKAYFEEARPKEWDCIRVEPIEQSFFDKLGASLNLSGGFFGKKEQKRTTGGGGQSYDGMFCMGAHKCP